MFTDDELLPISALQHWQYCPRRAALVHIEGLWSENRFTVEGRHLHERAHDPTLSQHRPGVQIVRGLELRSRHLGLSGKADVVEFHEGAPETAVQVVLVEYKRGRPQAKRDAPFQVQVCAQALCLEEMLSCAVAEAYLYFGKARQRVSVPLSPDLRARTLQAIEALHNLVVAGRTPPARFEPKCRRCSLHDLCLPKSLRPRATAARYLQDLLTDSERPEGRQP